MKPKLYTRHTAIVAMLSFVGGVVAGLGLDPDDPAARAFELFQDETDDCIPVVTREAPHELQGVVRRSDVMHALITQHRKAK